MKKLLLGALALLGVALVAPAEAHAHVSIAIGLPGFGVFVGPPALPPPPVVYAPAPVYYYPPYPRYYAPVPVFYGARHFHGRHHGYHRGW